MVSTRLTIATRKSPLALWQAHDVRDRLLRAHPDLQVDLLTLSTQGDRILDTPLAKIGGKGLFVKELENALLDGRADLAVHSMKDVPMAFPPGLMLATICAREDARDALVTRDGQCLAALAHGARIGTSSLRRQCQLRALRPDLQILDLRGNVNTRLAKLDGGEFDAIVLACAGLIRLGLGDRISAHLPAETLLPAVGQGAVGIECRSDDSRLHRLLAPLHDDATARRVRAERAMNERLAGGCQVPIAGHALERDGGLWLRGLVGAVDGSRILQADLAGPADAPEELGIAVAEALLAQGADRLLAALHA